MRRTRESLLQSDAKFARRLDTQTRCRVNSEPIRSSGRW